MRVSVQVSPPVQPGKGRQGRLPYHSSESWKDERDIIMAQGRQWWLGSGRAGRKSRRVHRKARVV